MGSGRLRLDDALAQLTAVQDESGDGGAAGGGADAEGAEAATAVDLMAGWSTARVKAWHNRDSNPNQYYYRFNAPGEAQSLGQWTAAEHTLFLQTLAACPDGKADYQWGTLSTSIPGRVGQGRPHIACHVILHMFYPRSLT